MKYKLFAALTFCTAFWGFGGAKVAFAMPPSSSSYSCLAVVRGEIVTVENCYRNVTWRMIPGSQQYSDATGTTTTYIGTNTIVRNGNLINFDIFIEGDVGYMRYEGNCRSSIIRVVRAADVLPSATYSPTDDFNRSRLNYACSRT